MSKVYAGDVGTDIILDCGSSIATATQRKILFKRPDGTSGEWMASAVAGQPSQLHYVLQAGDISLAGVWQLQAYVVMPNWTGRGETVALKVYAPFAS